MIQSPSDSYRFACPKCGNHLRADPTQAGTRCDCPKCGAAMRVPAPGKNTPASEPKHPETRHPKAQHPETESRHVGFPCGLCGTRIHALISQVGQKLECPDCGVMAVVPAPSAPKKKSAYAPAFEDHEAYEVEEIGAPTPPSSPVAKTSFSYKCLVCESLLSATFSQVGELLECPDCGHRQKIKKPKVTPKPKRPPAMDEEERDPYLLSPPIEAPAADMFVDIGDHEEYVQRARAMGILRGDYQRPPLPKRPFVTGVYSFPYSKDAWPRWLMLYFFALVASFCLYSGLSIFVSGASYQWGLALFLNLIGATALALGMVTASARFFTIFKSTAAGSDEVDWPDSIFTDWMFDLVYMVYSLSVSMLPCCLAVWLLASLGLETQWRGLIVFSSAFLLHPLVFLTITGAASPFIPYAPDVWRGMALASNKVVSFYVHLFFLDISIVLVVVTLALIVPNYFHYIFPGFAVAVAMIYFRLLGRLAWCCSDAVSEADEAAIKEEEGESNKDAIDQAHEAAMQ